MLRGVHESVQRTVLPADDFLPEVSITRTISQLGLIELGEPSSFLMALGSTEVSPGITPGGFRSKNSVEVRVSPRKVGLFHVADDVDCIREQHE